MDTLSLYRAILRAARHFPSSNKGALINEIKSEFHAHKGTADPAVLKLQRDKAVMGLEELQQWLPTNLSNAQGEWSVNLRGNTIK